MALFGSTDNPTPFGIFDDDEHFKKDADGLVLYVKRRLGDDILSVELTNKQIWANFEEATMEFSKQMNAHQAESYMSNILGLSTGNTTTFKKNDNGHYYWLDEGQNAEDLVDFPIKDKDGVQLQIGGDDATVNLARKNYQVLLVQDPNDPRFSVANKEARYIGQVTANTASVTTEIVAVTPVADAAPIIDKMLGPHGKEQKFPRETLEYLIRRAEPYASEAFVGGTSDSLRGYIELKHDKQDYNIYDDLVIPGPNDEKLTLAPYDPEGDDDQLTVFNPIYKSQMLPSATETKIRINEIFHFSPQAAYRFFDTTSAINYLNNQFAFESFTPETVFYVLPVFEDLLRAGQLDISNRVRRSNYSYKLHGQDLRIFPRPTQSNPLNLFIKFTFPSDPYAPDLPYADETIEGVSNISNIPFGHIKYEGINAMSRTWIKQYALALCKETLGLVRSKFSSVPIPGSDVQMNGSELISQGREDKQRLSENLAQTLEKLTYQKLLEADAAQSETMLNILKRVPVPNGRAIVIG